MISLVRFSEVRRMEGQKRQRGNNPLNFVPEVENEEDIDAGKRRRSSLGIRSEILKDEAGIVPVSGGGASAAQNHNSPYGYGEEDDDCDHAKSFKAQFQDVENHGGGSISGFGNMLGPGDYRRLISNNSQWNSESLSEYSEKYKRSISSSAGAAAAGAPGGAGATEEEERRVRSRPDQASSVVLTNLLGRSREETDLHMNISARTLRPSGGKDRHSKVFTAKGPRDRRVRLSVSTAIQFYDVQDRLGYDQPSKAVEWLMKKAKNAIDELSQIPLPGIDSLVPTSSSSMYHHHHHHHPYGGYSMPSHDQMSSHDQVYNPCTSSYSSTSELQQQQQQLKGVTQACSATELENPSHHQSSGTEMKAAGGRSEAQAVDESDGFTNRHAITGPSSSGTRRVELATEITMSVGGDAPPRSNQVQAAGAHHHPGVAAVAGLSSFSSSPLASMMNTSMMNTSHHHRQGLQLQQQPPPPRTASYMYEDALGSPAGGQRLLHHYNHHHQQQQQQASLVHHHQAYLQQNQEFLQSPSSAGSSVLPFSMVSPPQAKPYLDQFHSLKIAAAGGSGAEKVTGISSSPGLSSPRFGLGGSFLGSGSPGVYSPQNSNSKQQQQHQQEHIVGGFAAENSQLIQSFEEQLRGGNTKRD